MAPRILDRLRAKIREGQYPELYDDDISIFDVESIILTGEVTQRQYVVRGETLAGEAAVWVE